VPNRAQRCVVDSLEPRQLLTASVSLVRDINTQPNDFGPERLFSAGGIAYYTHYTQSTGFELWRSDGTTAGTFLLKDIEPGSAGSDPGFFVLVGSTVFFAATTSATGWELWKTDGTASGTVIVRDAEPGPGSSGPRLLRAFGNRLHYFAETSTTGVEPWQSDGTAAGTGMIVDLNPGPSGQTRIQRGDETLVSSTSNGTVFVGTVGTASGLYRTDGTAAGTILLRAESDSFPNTFRPANFVGNGSRVVMSQLWGGGPLFITDGTVAGTQSFESSTSATNPVFVDTSLYYRDGSTLWRKPLSNPAAAPTQIVLPSGMNQLEVIGAFGTSLMVTAITPTTEEALYRINNTGNSPVLVHDFASDRVDLAPGYSAGSLFYFRERSTNRLWRTSGSVGGTLDVSPFSGNGGDVPFGIPKIQAVAAGSRLVYIHRTPTTGLELWASNGTVAGSAMLVDTAGGTARAGPIPLARVGNTQFYEADDGINGTELWRSDGTAAGTALVRDINPGPDTSIPGRATGGSVALGNRLLFSAFSTGSGTELWSSDGTTGGTVLVLDIEPGTASSSPRDMVVLGNIVYFTATTVANGTTVWRSDGTTAGTFRVSTATLDTDGITTPALVSFNNRVYFSGVASGSSDFELWSTDGTAAGTTRLLDLVPGTVGSFPSQFVVAGSRLFFSAFDPAFGSELWSTDGTAAGTQRLTDINPGTASANPTKGIVSGNWLYFIATAPATGAELYRLAIGSTSPALLGDLTPGTASTRFSTLQTMNGSVYFAAQTPASCADAYQVNDAGAMTRLSQLGSPNGQVTVPQFIAHNGQLFFGTDNGVRGQELAVVDLRPGALPQLVDVNPGNFYGAFPAWFHVIGPNAFFMADSLATGAELFRVNDTFSPYIIRAAANVETRQSVEVDWSEPSVLGTGTVATLVSLPSNTPVAGVTVTPVLSTDGKRTTFTFSGVLPDGNYRLQLSATGLRDPASNFAPAQTLLDFHILAGDANRDRSVNFSDLLILAANYGQSSRTFSQGDFNYDGSVNFTDLLLLASRYNQTLAGAELPSTSRSIARKRTSNASVLN
jgi:ELWxxDGT repeat protein